MDCGVNCALLAPLGDGSFLVCDEDINNDTGRLVVISRQEVTGEVTYLTLATAETNYTVRAAAMEWNASHADVKIELIDYSVYGAGADGTLLLTTELLAGNYPDMLVLTDLNVYNYAGKGLLEDLNPYLDADPDFDRADYFDNILRAFETDGALYELAAGFSIETAAANRNIVGEPASWTLADLAAVMAANPQIGTAFGYGVTGYDLLEYAVYFNASELLDRDTGAVSFDSEFFIGLLETAKELQSAAAPDEEGYLFPMLEFGRQLLFWGSNFDINNAAPIYGDDLTFIGFPSESGGGSRAKATLSIGMSSVSEHKELCWQFMRTILLGGCSLSRESLEQSFESDRESAAIMLEYGYELGCDPELSYQKIRALYESVSTAYHHDDAVWQIVSDEAGAYFAGDRSAEQTAKKRAGSSFDIRRGAGLRAPRPKKLQAAKKQPAISFFLRTGH